MTVALEKQHLIDPEICIRCNTCEETCPIDAVTHNDDNYVVDAAKCNSCMDCISPCPTGAIDNWRIVARRYSLEEQLGWDELPLQEELAPILANGDEAVDDEVSALLAEAHHGHGGTPVAPASAGRAVVSLFRRAAPATARVAGNYRITAGDAETDVRHIILDFGDTPFPVLEGQSIGIVPPGSNGTDHAVRLYSVASPRDGEKPQANNLALTVKREPGGVCSSYLCDLARGATVKVTGPFGSTFLMPNDPAANIIMICTGTGSAPFRAFTERRRRAMATAPGKLMLFFGARRPEELPYFGPLQKVPSSLLTQHLCYSRVAGVRKTYVQDRMRSEADRLGELLRHPDTHMFICGLKGMERGVEDALTEVGRKTGFDWASLEPDMRTSGRYHVETY